MPPTLAVRDGRSTRVSWDHQIVCLLLVCTKKTQTKATVALVLQCVTIPVLLVVIGFLIAFVASDFTLCIGSQCSQTSTTFVSEYNRSKFSFSAATYTLLKRVFIVCELVCAVIFTQLSIIYIVVYVKCLQKLPHIHPVRRLPPITTAVNHQSISSARSLSMASIQHAQSTVSSQSQRLVSKTSGYYQAQKVCPECGHVSPYVPATNIVECPKCHYRSPFVEHAQQY